jgi:asparagine synthase (glutamine-hydrolysing)
VFCFGSDVRGVLACPGVPVKLSEPMLAAYLTQFTYHAEQRYTFHQGVVKLPPAHFLVVTRAGARLTRYWSPHDAPQIHLASPDAYAAECCARIENAVQNATRTTQRVGAHLSGGLDSTTVAILAARQVRARGESLNGYSWSPPLQKP